MKFSLSKPFTFDSTVRLVIYIVLFLALILCINYLRDVLFPFFVAWLMAYLLYPSVKFVQKRFSFMNRTLSVITVLFVIFGTIGGALWIFIPRIFSELIKFKTVIIKLLDTGKVIEGEKWWQVLHKLMTDFDLQHKLDKQFILDSAKDLFPKAWELLSNSFSIVISLFVFTIIILYLFFILKDYEKITFGLLSLVPHQKRDFVSRLLRDMERTTSNFYRGQALVALIVGILFCIGFSIIGLPLSILMGITLGVLNLVPYMQTLSIPLSVVLMLIRTVETGETVTFSLFSLLCVYLIIQAIQDLVLVPKIMGKAMGMNPSLILLSLSIWGTILGGIGLIIALPATTLILNYYKQHILTKLNYSEDQT